MKLCKIVVALLVVVHVMLIQEGTAEEKKTVPSKTEIATCLLLMTINDEWAWIYMEMKEDFEAEQAIEKFYVKLHDTQTRSCSFLFEAWDKKSLKLINTRITQVCIDDAENQNPYLGDGLHCKQALALQ